MWVSTIWIAVSIVLSFGGHPMTAVIPLSIWVAHRRWERKSYKRNAG
jgi:hypothetical protein